MYLFKVASFLCSIANSPTTLALLLQVLECGGFDVSSADYVSKTFLIYHICILNGATRMVELHCISLRIARTLQP